MENSLINSVNHVNSINNIINETTKSPEEDENILQFIRSIEDNYTTNKIIIQGKILYHNIQKTVLYFILTVKTGNDINPFKSNIIFTIDFIENCYPYIRILTDFIQPTLNDERNLFFCLSKNQDYTFCKIDLENCKNIFEEILSNIPKFLFTLQENEKINVLIYYGEFALGGIYLMNDFLSNKKSIKFYRVFDINDKKKEIYYIILTQLYFLLFEPVKSDKSFGKLVNRDFLSDINIMIKEKINSKKVKSYVLKMSNGTCDYINKEFVLTNNQFNNNENENDILKDCLLFKNQIEQYKKDFSQGKYLLVIRNSKYLYSINLKHNEKQKKFVSKKRASYYKKYIEYFEILINNYKDKKDDHEIKKRIIEYVSYITLFCVELLTFKDSDPKECIIYKTKLNKYLNYCDEVK